MKKKSPRPQRIVRRWRANRRPLKAQDQQRNKSSMNDVDYNIQLANFLAVRYSDQNLPPPAPKFAPSNATSSSAIPSDELVWTRDDSTKMESFEIADSQPESSEQQPGPSHQQTVVDEVEEGEIVEHDDISNLLSQSSLAVKNSRQLVDLSASPSGRRGRNLFYEDRVALKFGSVPIYNTYNDANDSVEQLNTSDDVICIDGSQTEQDDSVIFVCEDKPPPAPATRSNRRLSVPDCLKSPALSNLLKLVPSQRLPRASTSKAPKAPAVKSPRTIARQKLRITAWKEKKSREFAAKANGEQTEQRMVEPDTTTIEPSTSSADNVQRPEVKPKEPEKRIVLIDGSNVAMQYTDNRGSKKTDKDFAVEGGTMNIKLTLEHFNKKFNFQESRLRLTILRSKDSK